MTTTSFRFATDILRRLGEELNPHPDQGVVELVKNAFDADAIHCEVEIEDVRGRGQTIHVRDDGSGMTAEGVEDGWLILGRSGKSVEKVSKLGRRPSGNKGLGRLAALRLGTHVKLQTGPLESATASELEIDWSDFDNATVVEDVALEIRSVRRPKEAKFATEIEIRGVKEKLDRQSVRRLARELLLLADPFNDNPSGFQPVLLAKEYKDLEKLVRQRYFEDAEYHLHGEVDDKGTGHAEVRDWKGKVLFRADHAKLRPREAKVGYRCPPATFDTWIYILNEATFATRKNSLSEVREWLKEVGGVHLYIRGLRVLPYGEPGHDWLEMNLQRVKSPELRPGTNTSVGRFKVEDIHETLKQKTDRSGLIENDAYRDLKRFGQDALDWLTRERLAIREKTRQTKRTTASVAVQRQQEKVQAVVASLPKAVRQKVEVAVRELEKAAEKDRKTLQSEVQLYRTLSTAGISAETFAHEAGHPIKVIRDNARLIERTGKHALGAQYPETLAPPVDRIKRQTDSLEAFTQVTLNFVQRQKRRHERIDAHNVLRHLVGTFEPLMKERRVTIELDLAPKKPILFASESALESIAANHVLNSLKAIEKAGVEEGRVIVRTQQLDDTLLLVFLDNGTGVIDIDLDSVWLPGESSDPNGTGLGLAIVRDTVTDLGGSVSAKAKGELGGAEFHLKIPVVEWG